MAAHPHCQRCGRLAEHAHHKVPVAQGGADAWRNLEALCGRCHRAHHAGDQRAAATTPERAAWRKALAELVAKA